MHIENLTQKIKDIWNYSPQEITLALDSISFNVGQLMEANKLRELREIAASLDRSCVLHEYSTTPQIHTAFKTLMRLICSYDSCKTHTELIRQRKEEDVTEEYIYYDDTKTFEHFDKNHYYISYCEGPTKDESLKVTLKDGRVLFEGSEFYSINLSKWDFEIGIPAQSLNRALYKLGGSGC